MKALLHDRLARTLSANVLGRVGQALGPVVLVPVFLHSWGAAGYGEWLVLATIPAYLMGFADVGLPTVAANEMTMRMSRGDRDGALVVFQSTWALVTPLTVGALVVGTSAIWTLPLEAWLNIKSIPLRDLRLTLSLLIGGVFVSQQGFLASAGLRCIGAFPLQAFVTSLLSAANLVVQLVLLALGVSPVGLAAGMMGSSFGTLGVWAALMRKRTPWLQWGIARAERSTARTLTRPALAYLGLSLNNALSVQGVVTALGIVLGPVAVAAFSTVRTMTNAARQAMTLVTVSVWPEITDSFSGGRLHRARRLHRGAVAASVWLGLAVLLVLAVAGPTAYRLWIGAKVGFEPVLFYTLLGAAFAGLIGYTSSVVHLAVNRHTWLALVQVVGSALVFVAALWLARPLGVAAVGAVLFVVEAVTGVWIVRRSLALLGDHMSALLAITFRPTFRRAPLPVATDT